MDRQRFLAKVFSRRVFQIFPALFLCLLLSVTIFYTVTKSDSGLDNVVLSTNMDIMHEDLSFLLDTKGNSIQADFRGTNHNEDGSIDLVFRVKRKLQPAPTVSAAQGEHSEKHSEPMKGALTSAENQTLEDAKPDFPLTLKSEYLINCVNLCAKEKSIDYLIVVHSATAYFKRRREIRETFGGRRVMGTVSQAVVFLLGTTSDTLTTRLIQQEALQHGDIVQGRFKDSYHNLTHKVVMGLRWVSNHCPQAKLIVKIDDDTFINTFKLADEMLPRYSGLTRHLACHLRPNGTSVIERGKGRWKVSDNEFKGHKFYPFNHCNGYFVVMTADLVQPFVQAAHVTPFFWIDDVYAFGMLPVKIGNVTFEDIQKNLTVRYTKGKTCLDTDGLNCKFVAISEYKESGMETMWYSLLSNMTDSSMEKFKLFKS